MTWKYKEFFLSFAVSLHTNIVKINCVFVPFLNGLHTNLLTTLNVWGWGGGGGGVIPLIFNSPFSTLVLMKSISNFLAYNPILSTHSV